MLRSYGPGKFTLMIDSLIYQLSLNGCDDECGDVQSIGWFGLLKGPIKLSGPFADLTADQLADLTAEEKELLRSTKGAIIKENDQGFVTVDYYRHDYQYEAAWESIQNLCAEGDHE